MPAEPLTPEEEATVRAATASSAATFGTAVGILEVMPRVWATLDAARAPVPTDVPGLREAKEALFAASMEVSWMARPVAECWALIDAVALAASPDAPRVAGLDVERLEAAVFGAAFSAQDDVTEKWIGVEEVTKRIATEYARIGDTAAPATSTEDGA